MPQTYDRSLDSHPAGQLLEAHSTGEHHRSTVTVPGESANASVNPSTPSRRQRPTSAPLSRAHVAYPHASRASRTARFARANKRPRNGHQGRRRPTDSAGRKRGSPSATRDVDDGDTPPPEGQFSGQAACPRGWYCQLGVRSPCPAGRFGAAALLTSVDQCTMCEAGRCAFPLR